MDLVFAPSQVESWPIARLRPYARNAKMHGNEQVAKIAASMAKFGWTVPCMVADDGELIAGHGRVLAATMLGLTEVPVIRLSHLDEAERRAYRIADNKLTELGEWDEALLRDEIAELLAEDFDLTLLGISDDDLDALLRGPDALGGDGPVEGEDNVPELPVTPVSVPGDLWQLGAHRLICGDSTAADVVGRLLGDVRPLLMVTDPPYGVEYDPSWRNAAGAAKTKRTGKVLNDDRADWREAWALFPGDVAYVWHGALHAGTVADSLTAAGFAIRSQIIWAKDRLVLSRGDYHWQHEPCWYAVRAKGTLPARASLFGDDLTSRQARNGGQPFAVVEGIAVIEIAGTLVHRGAWIGQSSGLTSYEGIAAQLQAAVADPAIRGIALDIDSFGGEVAGAFDLADRIRAARQVKPVQAFVADHALSAAYALASQADRIILPRTGAVGSIGVVAMHSDMSGALDQKGIAVSLIHAGARKVDANPYQPLPESVRARIAGELEDLRQLFAETVAEGRGQRLDTLQALATEAAVFRGEAAVFAGLADEVADPVTAFRAFAAAPRGTATLKSNPKGKGPMMTTASEDHAQPAVTPAATTPPEPASPAAITPPQTTAAVMSPEAIRAEAAEVAQVCAQAARLGIQIDAADAVAKGVKPEALRAKILADLAARSDAADIIATAPAAGAKDSPIVAAAKKSAAASR